MKKKGKEEAEPEPSEKVKNEIKRLEDELLRLQQLNGSLEEKNNDLNLKLKNYDQFTKKMAEIEEKIVTEKNYVREENSLRKL